jgi:small subunit ribosomal protein S28
MTSVKEDEAQTSTSAPKQESFRQLLRNSRFVKSIDPVGKMADGEVLAISGEKMYIDFGSKFHAVVDMPTLERERYVEGAKVIIIVKNLEMTDHFLGAKKHISLLEAEAELVGLADYKT